MKHSRNESSEEQYEKISKLVLYLERSLVVLRAIVLILGILAFGVLIASL